MRNRFPIEERAVSCQHQRRWDLSQTDIRRHGIGARNEKAIPIPKSLRAFMKIEAGIQRWATEQRAKLFLQASTAGA